MLLRLSPLANSMPMYSLSSRLIRLNFFPTLVPSYGYFIQSGAITYGTGEWNKRSSSFNYYIENGTPVARGTLTASYVHSCIPQIIASQKTHAFLWVEGSHTELFESCIPMPKYGVALTLLWFVESHDGEDKEDRQEHRYEESSWKWIDPKE